MKSRAKPKSELKNLPAEDSIGKRFARLTVVEFLGRNEKSEAMVRALCDCGGEIITKLVRIRAGSNRSCGCLYREAQKNRGTHKMSGTPTWNIWSGMIGRCRNKNGTAYHHYGGRGIVVCERWLKFENFLEDMGLRPPKMEIERKDNNLGYFKDNCKWATRAEQMRNTRQNRLKASDIPKIRQMFSEGFKQTHIAREIGCSAGNVASVVHNQAWRDVK